MRLRLVLAAVALGLLAQPALAGPPPRVAADAYVVLNATTGEVLARHDDAERLPIASITKLMTVLVALEHVRADDVVNVSSRAASIGGATAGLAAGQTVLVRDLVRAALIASANDATNALAEHVGGSVERFVAMMNERARSIGLRDTHFARADGLDAPGHVSSARDATKLARVAMRNALVRETVDDASVTIGGRTLAGWNDLLSRPFVFDVVGVKTGHTDDAGWCQVAAARDPRGFTIYATILGSPTRGQRNTDLGALLTWAVDRYAYYTVIRPNRTYAVARTQYGRPDVPLVTRLESVALLRKGGAVLREEVVAPEVVALPVRGGQSLGEVRVYAARKLIASRPLVAARSVAKPGALGRTWWYTERAAENVWGWLT